MAEQYIFRTKVEKKHTTIRNSLINDKSLSWEARGLLIYLLSKPETWIVMKQDLINASPAAGKKTSSILKELEITGYIKREKFRNEKGQWEWHTWVYDMSIPPSIPPKRVHGVTIPPKTMHGETAHGEGSHIVSTELKKTEKEKKKESNNIITDPLKKKILSMGWVGSLGEIIKLYNENPDYVKAWVDEIYKIDLYPRAGLLLKALRSGELPSNGEIIKDYTDDVFANFIEN